MANPGSQILARTEADIRKSYLEHAARAQIYRWYAFYESPDLLLDNQLDLLAENFCVLAGAKSIETRDAYRDFIAKLGRPRTDAHAVKDISIDVSGGKATKMRVELLYINSDLAEDGSVATMDLSYDIELDQQDQPLPVFTHLNVVPIGQGRQNQFEATYATQRLLSLVHYWMALVENPKRTAAPFGEILSNAFELDFGSAAVTTLDGLAEWLAGPASSIEASRHDVSNLVSELQDDGSYKLSVDLDWSALSRGGEIMTARTRHHWIVVDNLAERFPRIKELRFELLRGGFG